MTIPKEFLRFDIRDTIRVVIWLVLLGFGAGGFYVQRQADLIRLEAVDLSLRAMIVTQNKTISTTNQRLSGMTDLITRRGQNDAVITASLEGIRTELRYVNEKIDVLRQDVRNNAAKRP